MCSTFIVFCFGFLFNFNCLFVLFVFYFQSMVGCIFERIFPFVVLQATGGLSGSVSGGAWDETFGLELQAGPVE